jgi:hypothetical protein
MPVNFLFKNVPELADLFTKNPPCLEILEGSEDRNKRMRISLPLFSHTVRIFTEPTRPFNIELAAKDCWSAVTAILTLVV